MSVTIYNTSGSETLWSSSDNPLYYKERSSPVGTERGVVASVSFPLFLYTLSSDYSGLSTVPGRPSPNVSDGDLLSGDYYAVGGAEPPPRPGATVNIYSNDGSELLGTVVSSMTPSMTFYAISVFYNDDYKRIANSSSGIPVDSGFDLTPYAGVANVPNASAPTYEDGYSFGNSGTYTVYVVESGGSTLDVTYNGSKIIDSLEVTPPVTITYNGSTIAALNDGDTRTLSCNGKVMASDVVIGGKTLQCNGKLMASDVVVSVSGEGGWDYPVLDGDTLTVTQAYSATQNADALEME